MESYCVMQVEDVGKRVGSLPSFREAGLHIQVLVAREQRVEQQFADALRLRVESNAGIEIGGTAFDDHDQRVGVGRLGTGDEREENHRR